MLHSLEQRVFSAGGKGHGGKAFESYSPCIELRVIGSANPPLRVSTEANHESSGLQDFKRPFNHAPQALGEAEKPRF
jgi:hypothetical protein